VPQNRRRDQRQNRWQDRPRLASRRNAADWRTAVDECQHDFGGLDILVNNAGIANVKGVEETSEEEWDSIVNINQKGVWLGMKAAVPAMRQRAAAAPSLTSPPSTASSALAAPLPITAPRAPYVS
jgi:NAD(P)-dependent dehydrogenase (short-subunit alcohol dehydrogenase family)